MQSELIILIIHSIYIILFAYIWEQRAVYVLDRLKEKGSSCDSGWPSIKHSVRRVLNQRRI